MYFIGALDPFSTKAGWKTIIEVADTDTGDDINLTGARIVCEVRDRKSGAIVLSGSTDNGKITIIDIGFFQINFPTTDTVNLAASTYDVGVKLTTAGGDDVQLIIGSIPILDGVVTI